MGSIPSKEKAMKKLSEWEDKTNSVCISISINRKIVDGKVTVSACVHGDSGGTIGLEPVNMEQQPVPSEYTDMDKFSAVVSDIIKSKAKALS